MGYKDGIKDIKNIRDNFMYMVAMFDIENMKTFSSKLSKATRAAVKERIISGGSPEWIYFQ